MTRQRFYLGILLLYAVVVGVITLKPAAPSDALPATWIPLLQIWRIVTNAETSVYADIGQVVGNIVLFVPLGWLLPMISARLRTPARAVAMAAACSIVIELTQLFALRGRSPATDDVLLNTFGALVGAIMFFAPRALPDPTEEA